jgi:uncharacterized protein
VQVRIGLLGFVIVGSLGMLVGCTAEPAEQGLETSGTSKPTSIRSTLTRSVPDSIPGASDGSLAPSVLTADQPVPTIPTVAAAASVASTSTARPTSSSPSPDPTSTGSAAGLRLVAAARAQVGVTTGYDPAYVGLSFPGGDVDAKTGVCSDVVVRALRGLGIDLQERLHLDMKAHFGEYPTKWGLSSPDPNIDHRRVPNIATYFARRGYEQPVTNDPADYQPGDIVWIKLPVDHIGIVSDRTIEGRPLLIHNIGQGAREEDVLFSWKIVGRYRVVG